MALGLKVVADDVLTKLGLKPLGGFQVVAGPDGKFPGDIKEGDIVFSINGKTFDHAGAVGEIVRELPVGQNAELKVYADGKVTTRSIPIIEKPRDHGDNYDVIYDSVLSTGHRIRTIVTKPKAAGKHPVLFWIQGINNGTIDFPLTATNVNVRILKAFSDDGYVTVRVEKPGVGDSEGGPARLVAFDEENDIYRQALKALDKYDFVDRSRVYIFGHSMGGCHAPIIASEMPVKGIITYGTVSDSWLEWEIKAVRAFGFLTDVAPGEIDKQARQTVTFFNALYNEKKSIAQIRQEHPELEAFIKDQSPDGESLSDRSVRYMVELNDKNFTDYWTKVGEARVLALFGENDYISLQHDQEQIPQIVNLKHPGHAEFQKVKASDHFFNVTTSMRDSLARFGKPGTVFNPEIVRVMKEWIASLDKS